MKKLISAIIVLVMLFSLAACGAQTAEEQVTPASTETSEEKTEAVASNVEKTEMINITTMMLEDNIRNVPDNMDVANNPWIELFKENGINVTYAISGSQEDLTTKLNMAIATDDLPDVMMATAEQFQELCDAGMLAVCCKIKIQEIAE